MVDYNLNQQLAAIQNQINGLQALGKQPYNPYQPVYQPAPAMQSPQIQHVAGLEGAKAYQRELPASSSVILMDSNEDKFYMVSKDANGNMNPVVVGKFTLEQEENNNMYVTKQDFNELKAEIMQLLKGAKDEQSA